MSEINSQCTRKIQVKNLLVELHFEHTTKNGSDALPFFASIFVWYFVGKSRKGFTREHIKEFNKKEIHIKNFDTLITCLRNIKVKQFPDTLEFTEALKETFKHGKEFTFSNFKKQERKQVRKLYL